MENSIKMISNHKSDSNDNVAENIRMGGTDTPVTREGWMAALNIVIYKPHSVDKRLAGQVEMDVWDGGLGEELCGKEGILSEEVLGKIIEHIVREDKDVKVLEKVLGMSKFSNEMNTTVILQKLVARTDKISSYYQVVVIQGDVVEFVPLNVKTNGRYRLQLLEKCESSEDKIVINLGDKACVSCTHSRTCSAQQVVWLRERLIPRLIGWATDRTVGSTSRVDSLRLVGLEQYGKEYQRLKDKYAKDIISNWAESSDPEKFVHEDLGIAAYILLLWRQQRQEEQWEEGRKQSFVDLGCGNGLLVYLLTMEGHKGVGYDIRKRNIWDWFPDNVELKEETICPNLSTSFPGKDWVLGNHSDELTPWVPIIAAMSGPATSYWVLPCCPFNFASKYQRRNATKSVWRDYLDWLRQIGDEAGFLVEEDRMRIPSTKRVCLVGKQRKNGHVDLGQIVSSYTGNFVPREKVEKVRNCSQVDKVVVGDIVDKVVAMCLQSENYIQAQGCNWNCGGKIQLNLVANSLVEQGVDLTKLKAECGGLQTLFRNHHFIFVVEKGMVRLRIPGTDQPRSRRGKLAADNSARHKTKPCWHHHHHPQGCPLIDQDCQWSH